jgi:hypothetical protein
VTQYDTSSGGGYDVGLMTLETNCVNETVSRFGTSENIIYNEREIFSSNGKESDVRMFGKASTLMIYDK